MNYKLNIIWLVYCALVFIHGRELKSHTKSANHSTIIEHGHNKTAQQIKRSKRNPNIGLPMLGGSYYQQNPIHSDNLLNNRGGMPIFNLPGRTLPPGLMGPRMLPVDYNRGPEPQYLIKPQRTFPNAGSLGDVEEAYGMLGDEKQFVPADRRDGPLLPNPMVEPRQPGFERINPSLLPPNDVNNINPMVGPFGPDYKAHRQKTWVTDVNVYSKKKKLDELEQFLAADDTDEDDEFDPCASVPCHNGGVCRVRGSKNYECICQRRFSGRHCTKRSHCHPSPCLNDGRCTETATGFECTCAIGYKGFNCREQNHCLPNPCLNDGMCNENSDGFVCSCKSKFSGKTCSELTRACDLNPCSNDGRCIQITYDSIECLCQTGYYGRFCEQSELVDEAAFSSRYKLGSAISKSFVNHPYSPTPSICRNYPCMNNGVCTPDATIDKGFKCQCGLDFQGVLCQERKCPCKNGGFCVNDGTAIKCICKQGYTGHSCEEHTQCNEDTCMHGGICIEEVGSFRCKCDGGYKGKRCDESDHCTPNPCQHNGKCHDYGDFYKCDCVSGYQGKQCAEQNYCLPNPCHNGGICLGYTGGFQCDCPKGFQGKSCQSPVYCYQSPCQNGGICAELPTGFKCTCSPGYLGDTCDSKDSCSSSPCFNGGTCFNEKDGFSCACGDRYKGASCEVTNFCLDTPCKNGGKCTEMIAQNTYKCECLVGYTGRMCEATDECQPNPCHNDGRCAVNPAGGFSCNCPESYRGVTCAEQDPCLPNPCSHGTCAEVNGGYVCNCTLGFRGPTCSDVDRCNPSPCFHDGSCREIVGGVGYVCDCPMGYKGQMCDLKDPCRPTPCLHESLCQEILSDVGYTCSCSQGYRGTHCQAVDPCYPNPCSHDGVCLLDGENSFKCNCSLGFKGNRCQDVDLCTPNPCRYGTHCIQTDAESYQCVKNLCTPNPCLNDGKCIVVNDETYECACQKGWKGRNCNEQDSCYPNPCLNGGTCTDGPLGGFTCGCQRDFKGATCSDTPLKNKIDYCLSSPCKNGGTCINMGSYGTFTCRCSSGFNGPICEESVCVPNPCENGGTCVPYYGIALCKCADGYGGAHCTDNKHQTLSQISKSPSLTVPPSSPAPPHTPVPASPPKVEIVDVKTKDPPVATTAQQATNGDVKQATPNKDEQQKVVNIIKKQDLCEPNPCSNDGACVLRNDGQPECICKDGNSGPACRDECKHCDKDAVCIDGHCICRKGYVGDGLECWPEKERDRQWNCLPNPCQNGGTCKPGRAKCVCKLGYTGTFCENYCPPSVHLSFDRMQGNRAIDESGNNNDAFLKNGAEIVFEGGKCDSGAALFGGDILFDGDSFDPKPKTAITMTIWVKLDTNRGIQSIFDTVGGKGSTHKEGQYHVEIDNGRVRWFHRNSHHVTIFSVMSSQSLISENQWTHIAGTYDGTSGLAKLYVNGDVVGTDSGSGILSQDWGSKAGIGKHEHPFGNRLLRGMVDEFYIFNCPLPRLEILVLMHHCKIYFAKNKKINLKEPPLEKNVENKLKPPTINEVGQDKSTLPTVENFLNFIIHNSDHTKAKALPATNPNVWSSLTKEKPIDVIADSRSNIVPQTTVSRYQPQIRPKTNINRDDFASPELELARFLKAKSNVKPQIRPASRPVVGLQQPIVTRLQQKQPQLIQKQQHGRYGMAPPDPLTVTKFARPAIKPRVQSKLENPFNDAAKAITSLYPSPPKQARLQTTNRESPKPFEAMAKALAMQHQAIRPIPFKQHFASPILNPAPQQLRQQQAVQATKEEVNNIIKSHPELSQYNPIRGGIVDMSKLDTLINRLNPSKYVARNFMKPKPLVLRATGPSLLNSLFTTKPSSYVRSTITKPNVKLSALQSPELPSRGSTTWTQTNYGGNQNINANTNSGTNSHTKLTAPGSISTSNKVTTQVNSRTRNNLPNNNQALPNRGSTTWTQTTYGGTQNINTNTNSGTNSHTKLTAPGSISTSNKVTNQVNSRTRNNMPKVNTVADKLRALQMLHISKQILRSPGARLKPINKQAYDQLKEYARLWNIGDEAERIKAFKQFKQSPAVKAVERQLSKPKLPHSNYQPMKQVKTTNLPLNNQQALFAQWEKQARQSYMANKKMQASRKFQTGTMAGSNTMSSVNSQSMGGSAVALGGGKPPSSSSYGLGGGHGTGGGTAFGLSKGGGGGAGAGAGAGKGWGQGWSGGSTTPGKNRMTSYGKSGGGGGGGGGGTNGGGGGGGGGGGVKGSGGGGGGGGGGGSSGGAGAGWGGGGWGGGGWGGAGLGHQAPSSGNKGNGNNAGSSNGWNGYGWGSYGYGGWDNSKMSQQLANNVPKLGNTANPAKGARPSGAKPLSGGTGIKASASVNVGVSAGSSSSSSSNSKVSTSVSSGTGASSPAPSSGGAPPNGGQPSGGAPPNGVQPSGGAPAPPSSGSLPASVAGSSGGIAVPPPTYHSKKLPKNANKPLRIVKDKKKTENSFFNPFTTENWTSGMLRSQIGRNAVPKTLSDLPAMAHTSLPYSVKYYTTNSGQIPAKMKGSEVEQNIISHAIEEALKQVDRR